MADAPSMEKYGVLHTDGYGGILRMLGGLGVAPSTHRPGRGVSRTGCAEA